MTELARLVDLTLRRHRRDLEQRRRRLARVGLIPLDEPDTSATVAEVHAEPPAGGAVVIRLERPAGGGRRETR